MPVLPSAVTIDTPKMVASGLGGGISASRLERSWPARL
jgi:hypothetical protein